MLVNTTRVAEILVKRKGEGNYTCVATNKYGTDIGVVSILFTGNTTLVLSSLIFIKILNFY